MGISWSLCWTGPPADVITLDRVICCYPDMEKLVGVLCRQSEKAVRTGISTGWMVDEDRGDGFKYPLLAAKKTISIFCPFDKGR